MKITPVSNPKLCHISLEQLREIAASLTVDLSCGDMRLVTFSPTAPSNTSIPWQLTDNCGGTPIGKIRVFKNGEWV